MIMQIKSQGSRPLFLRIPSYEEVLLDTSINNTFVLGEICKKENICIDPAKRINKFISDKENPKKYFDCSLHYCKEIHYLVAEEIKSFLTSH